MLNYDEILEAVLHVKGVAEDEGLLCEEHERSLDLLIKHFRHKVWLDIKRDCRKSSEETKNPFDIMREVDNFLARRK